MNRVDGSPSPSGRRFESEDLESKRKELLKLEEDVNRLFIKSVSDWLINKNLDLASYSDREEYGRQSTQRRKEYEAGKKELAKKQLDYIQSGGNPNLR